MKKAAASGAAPPKPMAVVDGKTALADITQSFGMVPEFLRRYPQEGLAGAWTEMRDVEMNPSTAIPGKYKSLMGLGVASQIPCRYCIIADTEFAKAEGANEREITEAVAMAGAVRYWSTILNGRQVDKAMFKKDVNRLVAGAKKMMAAEGPMAAAK
jgi:AhpD family alkylhydroperoxidase